MSKIVVRCACFVAMSLAAAPAFADSSYQPYYIIRAPAATPTTLPDHVVAAMPVSDVAPPPPVVMPKPLPTFVYDPKLDPKNVPYVAPASHDVQDKIKIGTDTGAEIGLQLSDYRYQEHDVAGAEFMHLLGGNIGLTFDGNKSYSNGWFWGGDARVAYGRADYTGAIGSTPVKQSGDTNVIVETRAIGGHDFLFDHSFWGLTDIGLSPYAGLGFRFLYNDSSNPGSYARYSHYFYAPVGLTSRFRLTNASRLSLNTEFDEFIYGWQVSALGDVNAGDSDLTNSQHGGYGLRGSLMYERRTWSVGPFFNYWNINESDYRCSTLSCGDEPHSQTIEYGLQGRYRF